MKHLRSFTIAFSLMAGSALASPFDGTYVGVEGGYESITQSGSYTGAIGTAMVHGFSATGGNYGLFGGYGKTFNNLYLGAELEGSMDDGRFSFSDDSGDHLNVREKYTYGADMRVGYLPSASVLLYSSLGDVRSKFDTQTSVSSGSDWLNGVRFGVGVETILASQVSVRLEWAYTDYDGYRYNDSSTLLHFTPNENLIRIGLAYHFQ